MSTPLNAKTSSLDTQCNAGFRPQIRKQQSLKGNGNRTNRYKLNASNHQISKSTNDSLTSNPGVQHPVCIVTGGSRGIGRAIALELARHGAKVVINDVIQAEEFAEKTAEDVRQAGGEAHIVYGDVSQEEHVTSLFDNVLEKWGRVDVLVNNAGITRDDLMLRMKPEMWRAVINVNLTGVFLCTQGAMKVMKEQGSGRIVNITSVSGLAGNAGQANYSSAKAGVVGITKVAAAEMAPYGVLVNAVAPGFIESDMTAKLSEKVKAKVVEEIPMGRMGTVSEVSGVVKFLALDPAAGYINGHVVVVDGGLTSGNKNVLC